MRPKKDLRSLYVTSSHAKKTKSWPLLQLLLFLIKKAEHLECKLRSSGMISFLSFTVISNFNQNVIVIPRNCSKTQEGMLLSHLWFLEILEIFVNTKQWDVTITLLLTSVSLVEVSLETDFVATWVLNVAGEKPWRKYHRTTVE